MAQPLIIPASRDPQDTRPNTSGNVPAVHYNVPMYQPLQTEQGFNPGDALLNILSNGSYANGGSMTQGWKNTGTQAVQMFDPRTKAGIANLASIFVPGDKLGNPTRAQQNFLDAIFNSSRTRDPRQGFVYRPADPSVGALMQHMGEPANRTVANPQDRATVNPLIAQKQAVGNPALGLAGFHESWLGGKDGGRIQGPPMGETDMTHNEILNAIFHMMRTRMD